MSATHSSFPSFVIAATLACTSSLLAQASWQLAYPAQSPPPNYDWSAAFDEVRGEAIFVFPRETTNQLWRWNGTTWAQLTGQMPPNRTGAYMVWDAARQRVVLWGGAMPFSQTQYQDMWEWDGSSWQQRVVSMPPGRSGAAVAYDRRREVTVMFGGRNPGTTVALDDTWEWNGLGWSSVNSAVRPSARENAAMAFDPSTQRTLLFGGNDANGLRNVETWTWDGIVWQQHSPATPPFLRDRPALMSDLARARIVLYGGSLYDFQTWEWNGSQWQASNPGSLGAWQGVAGVYDPGRREVIVQGGGIQGGQTMNQTWKYRTSNLATATTFGAACPGSPGMPSLANAPYSLPWLGDTVRTRVANIAQTSIGSLFVTSFAQSFLPMSLAPLGAPGCDLYLQPDSVEFRTPVGLFVDWTLAIPSTTSLAGVVVFQQALPVDVAANPLGLTATNGLRMVVGIR